MEAYERALLALEAALAIYWENLPSPYEVDMEDANAAVKHIQSIVEAYNAALRGE